MISPVLGNIIAAGLVILLAASCVRFLIKEAKSGGCAGCSGHCGSCGKACGPDCQCSPEEKRMDEAFFAWRAKHHPGEVPGRKGSI